MSVNALKEFLIHFHNYRNIDLINQGLYQIRCRVYYLDENINQNNSKNYAIPYFFSDSKGTETIQKNNEANIRPHNIISNHISENNYEYVSKTFLIRYYDEEVELDEFCYFRLELPSDLVNSNLTYFIEYELFFSDALLALDPEKKLKNPNLENKNNLKTPNNVLNNAEFKSASKQMCKINYDANFPGYIESFVPITYTDSFLSILNTSVHMIILDYKLRLNNFTAFSCKGNSLPIKEQGNEPRKISNKNLKYEDNISNTQKNKDDKGIIK